MLQAKEDLEVELKVTEECTKHSLTLETDLVHRSFPLLIASLNVVHNTVQAFGDLFELPKGFFWHSYKYLVLTVLTNTSVTFLLSVNVCCYFL